MNNHQLELAEKLGGDGYLEYCVCSTLAETLENFNESNLKIFPPVIWKSLKFSSMNYFLRNKPGLFQATIKRHSLITPVKLN